jgi:hypothetical protein
MYLASFNPAIHADKTIRHVELMNANVCLAFIRMTLAQIALMREMMNWTCADVEKPLHNWEPPK